ncbi:MAG: hypothetical protein QME94_11955, partial [Anaerolineae bacterium]|nr:hypothetical protein [Anaerolineae bacterium]
MRQTLLVARRELRQRVLSRGFVLTSIATPLILIVVWALTGAFGTSQGSPAQVEMPRQIAGTVGYVDQAGLIRRIPEVVPPGMLQAFADP